MFSHAVPVIAVLDRLLHCVTIFHINSENWKRSEKRRAASGEADVTLTGHQEIGAKLRLSKGDVTTDD